MRDRSQLRNSGRHRGPHGYRGRHRGRRPGTPGQYWWRRPVAAALSVALAGAVALAGTPQAVAAPPSGPAYNPLTGNQGFLVFVERNGYLNTNTTDAAVAIGGDLAISQTNLALGRPVTASSTSGTLVPANATDGDSNTYWQSASGFPQTLTVDLTSTRTFNRLNLVLPPSFPTRTQTIAVQGSTDGTTFGTILGATTYTFNPASGNMVTLTPSPSNVRYIRLVFTGNSAVSAAQLAEIEVHTPASGQGNTFAVANQSAGSFTAPGDARPTALLVNGAIDWPISANNGVVDVRSNGYVKLGNPTGTDVLQPSANPTRLVRSGANYSSSPAVRLQIAQPPASVTQSGLVNFSGAFSTFRSRASDLAVCDNTVVLRNQSGTPLPAVIPPGTNALVSLTQGSQNVLNITAANLANLSTITFQNQPNASTPLIVNVYTAGVGDVFTWSPPNLNGLGDTDAGFVMWNFATTTQLTVTGSAPVRGTVYAPNAGLFEYNTSGVVGAVVSRTYAQGGPTGTPSGGDIRNFPFATTVQGCGAPLLTITKTADATTTVPGNTVRYTVSVTNPGAPAQTGATFTDALADVLDDATYNNDATATTGTVNVTGTNLTWTGDLPSGASATVTFSVTVRRPDPGNHRLVNRITSTTAGSNCASGSTDPRCTTNIPISDLLINKTANTSTTTPGSTVQYTITLTNLGQTAYTGISVVDDLSGVLDDATYNNNASASAGTVSFASPNLTWTGNLAVGAGVTITFSVTTLPPNVGDNVLINVVSSTAAGNNCPAGSTDTRCRPLVAVLVPGLTVSKTADATTAVPGATVSYTVTIGNTGQTPYTGVSVSDALADVLDDATYDNNASANAGTVVLNGTNLVWTGDLAVGASVTVTFSVTVRRPDTGNHRLVNVMTTNAAGSNCATGSTDPRCRVDIPVADLEVEFTATPGTTTPGAVVRFDARFTNLGQVPYTGITLALPRAGISDDATANGDQTATSGTLTLNATALLWTGDIPVGGEVTVTGTITVNNPDTGNRLIEGAISTTAPGSNCPPDSTDPRCGIAVPVLVPQLTIVKTTDAPATAPGQVLRFTTTVTNSGTTTYDDAVVTDDLTGVLDEATWNGDATASSGTLALNGTTLTWTGDLAVDQDVTITYSVTVNAATSGDNLIVNRVTSTEPGSTCPPATGNPNCFNTVPILLPQLTIVKNANAEAVSPGDVVTYTVTVTNSGQLPYSGAQVTDNLTQVLDDASYNGDATATAGTVSFTSPNLVWTGNLAVGATVTVSYSVTVQSPDPGNLSLVNVVTSTAAGNNCPAGGTDPRCTSTVQVRSATTLVLEKVADRTATAHGQTITYTVTVRNTTAAPFSGATFTDILTGALDDASYNGDATATAGTVSFASPNLVWTGNVPAGGTVTVTYSMTVHEVDQPGGNDLVNNRITSTSVSTNCPAASTDRRCLVSVPVVHLEIVNTAEPATSTTPGSVVRFNVSITNDSPVPQFGVVVTNDPTDVTDDATPTGDQTATSGSLVLTADGVTWTGDLAAGQTVLITGTVTVNNPDTGNRVLRGRIVSTSLGSSCPPGSTDPDCGVEVQVLVPELTVSKAADRTTVLPGGTVNYTVTVTNSGTTPYTGARVDDDLSGVLDDATYNGDASAGSGALSYTAPTLTWIGDLAVGQVVTITFSITVNNPDLGDHALVNRVVSTDTGSSCPPASGAAGCTASAVVLEPRLTISKSSDVSGTAPGGEVTYTLTVTNNGQVPYTGAEVTDNLAGVLDDADYNGDAEASTGTVDVDGTTLTWTGNLAIGATATVTYSVTVDDPDTGDRQLTNSVVSTEAGNNCPAGGTDPRCTTSVPVSILTITNTADVATTIPGGVVRYTVTVTNTGQTPYFGITVSDALADVFDDARFNGDGVSTTGVVTFDFATGRLNWTGDLPVGGSVTITGSVTVNSPPGGNTVLTSEVSTTAVGSNCPPESGDPRCRTAVEVLIPGLTIEKTANTAGAIPGQTIGYTITVRNTGETAYDDAVVNDDLEHLLDDATYNGDATASTGTVTLVDSILTWTGDLPLDATATITYSVTVRPAAELGDRQLENTVSSTEPGSSCPIASANPACTVVLGVLIPGLTLTKAANATGVTAGDTVQYTITISNTGQTTYQGISVTDNLAGVLDDADYNGDATASAGTVALVDSTLTWTGDLAPEETVFVRYSVTVHDPVTGDRVMTNPVVSNAPGSNCPTGSTDQQCNTTVSVLVEALALTVTADTTTVVEGGTVRYTVTLTNTGQAPYVGITVRNLLAGVLDDATYDGDASASAGTVDLDGTDLVWTGDIGVGDAVTITYSVTVDVPAAGDRSLVNVVTSTVPGSGCPPPGSSPGCTSTVTVVERSITLTDLTPEFTLTGIPGSTVQQEGAVTMRVTTNSLTGYQVSVRAESEALLPTTPGRDEFIPIENLRVRETGGGEPFTPLSAVTPVVVHSQDVPSAPGGDVLSNDYQVTIPLTVTTGEYVATLHYVAVAR